MAEENDVSAKALYTKLATTRSPYLDRARRAAELTVPYLMPKEGASGSTVFVEPSQGLGARGLRHLAAKLNNSLFPVNQPFFKHAVDDIALQNLTQQDDKRGEVDEALNARERAVMAEFNSSMFRPVSFEACRQLVLSGNYLLYIPKEGKPRGWRMDSYVVERDGSGNLLRIVLHEKIAKTALPEDVMSQLSQVPSTEQADPNADIDIYTIVTRLEDGSTFEVKQEIEGVFIEGQYGGTYPEEALPFVPLRFSYVEGEDYGRGFVDEYIGDLNALEVMTEALRDGTIQGAKVIWLVSPNSTVNPKKLAAAANGSFVQGEEGSIKPLRLDKQADFAVAERYITQLTERLSYAFLLHTAVQRKGERVTAEEIRYMASELDQGLGGVYSLLSEEFQMPVVRLFQLRMEHSRKVPPLPKEVTNTSIVTGLEALGRGNDLQNLDALVAGAAQMFGPEALSRFFNAGEYFKRRGAALGVDMGGLVKSEEEVAESDQMAQMQQLIEKLGPQAISQLGGAAQNQAAPGAESGEQIDG